MIDVEPFLSTEFPQSLRYPSGIRYTSHNDEPKRKEQLYRGKVRVDISHMFHLFFI